MTRATRAPTARPVAPAKIVRCAVYTRKSTEEGLDQAFNSLDAQREAGEAYVRSQAGEGWAVVPARYEDGGFTGGNLDRPGLCRLMADIQAGKVDCVVVYKVDRLSQSLLDFAQMMRAFEDKRVSFVSVTQQFNTGTSMGRLVLNVLLSFAQFEREIISERTRDKIAATRRKGKWAGGHPVLGYDVDPRAHHLVVKSPRGRPGPGHFRPVRRAPGPPPGRPGARDAGVGEQAGTTRKGMARGGQPFTRTNLYKLLTNVVYASRVWYKHEVHPGEHPVWAVLTPTEQARVVRLVVARVEYDGAAGQVAVVFRPAGVQALATDLAGGEEDEE